MALKGGLLLADVSHMRLHPRQHSLRYKVYYLCFPIQHMKQMAGKFLSLGRFNIFSIRMNDYGFTNRQGYSWVSSELENRAVTEADGDIVLVTLPRLLGYAFNPVSFWFCLDKQEHLRAVMAEVNNTFGERQGYVCIHEDHRPIDKDDWLEKDKIFHVSPLLNVRGTYRFRFAYSEEKIGVWIDYYDGETKMLTTSLVGRRYDLTDGRLLYYFFRYPMITLKVIAMIHYHALRLVLKGIHYNRKPSPPSQEVT